MKLLSQPIMSLFLQPVMSLFLQPVMSLFSPIIGYDARVKVCHD
jgi:hypothetical protein